MLPEEFILQREPVRLASSNVLAIAYDIDTNTLQVQFNDGSVYHYYDVPEDVAIAMLKTTSPGRFVWNELRDVYAYTRVSGRWNGPRLGSTVVRKINNLTADQIRNLPVATPFTGQ